MTGWEEITVSNYDPETFGQCPVCHTTFEQPKGRGRRRVYCNDICKNAEFRRVQRATKLTSEARSALVKQQMAVGDWRFTLLPEWLHYRCLACGQPVGAGPAHYDWNDYHQTAGVYRRIICATCAK